MLMKASADASNGSGEDPPDLKKEGWLERKGGLVFKSWQKRYFVMDGQKLQWYPNADKKKRSGYIDIDRAKATVAEGKSSTGFVFNLEIRGKKNYLFRTQTGRDRSEWMDFMNRSAEQTQELFSAWSKEGDCVNCIKLALEDAPAVVEEKEEKGEGTSGEGDDKGSIEKLRNLPLKDTSGNIHLFKDVIGKWDFTLIALLRHFG